MHGKIGRAETARESRSFVLFFLCRWSAFGFDRIRIRCARAAAGANSALEAGAQTNQRSGVNLRDARFTDTQDGADLLHGHFFEVIEGEDLPLFFVEFVDSG